MQQHRRGNRGNLILKNQNTDLSPSAVTSIIDLVSNIDDDSFRSNYLRETYASKFADPLPSLADARRAAAIEKWRKTEERNRETNERLRSVDRGFNILPRLTLASFLRHCRRTVSAILGPLTDDIVVGKFSGGASTSLRRTNSHPANKYSGLADATEECRGFTELLYRNCPLLRKFGTFDYVRVVEGAVLFTVPKNSDIDRCACKEPDLNMYLQKGVGDHIRRRLRRKANINLNDQSINRDLARLGSIDGSLATLDLSSASDTISIELVRLLLPSDWFLYLNDIRSRTVEIDGDTVVTEMFSSMGNGFTFELESLLFYSIVKSVLYFEGIPGRLSVYGDDIICPTNGCALVIYALNFFGFIVNEGKSFTTGPFRESCGGHYYNGRDVTPFYLKRPPKKLTDLIRVANQLRNWLILESDWTHDLTWSPYFHVWEKLRNFVPSNLWGGSDLSLDTQLVTAHNPSFRLVRIKQKRTVVETGRYLLWQNSNWNRMSVAIATDNDETDTSLVCRRRRVPIGSDVVSRVLFLEEVS